MRAIYLAFPIALSLAACGFKGTGEPAADKSGAPAATVTSADDGLRSKDPAVGAAVDPAMADDTPRPVMQAQVVLDRLGFTPGVVDGKEGLSTRNAVTGFQEANDLTVNGTLDAPTAAALAKWTNIPATRIVTIPDGFAAGPFYLVPKKPEDQAKMQVLGYETLDEKLAERFHTTVDTLKMLNPGGVPAGMNNPGSTASPSATPTPTPSASATGATFAPQPGPASFFRAGQQIRVPNVGADAMDTAVAGDPAWADTLTTLGVGTTQPKVARIVVSKSKDTLRAYDDAGKLVAMFTATMGSTHDPLPLGKWKINGVSKNPDFNYNPDLFWDAKAGDKKAHLPPGPNGPVGVVWIDLSKDHYGIHGTSHPETIGRAESHGCVRLTNWDVARLAQMVSAKTQVLFEA